MPRVSTRKPLVFAAAMLAVALIGFFLWQYTSPFPLGLPKDRILVDSFHANRQTFETLKQMADEDTMIASNNTSDSLSVTRRSEYARLLSQIHAKMRMAFDAKGTIFSFAEGGVGLSIGPSWSKGIAYLPAPSWVGQIVKNLDKNPGHDDMYLVPIEGNWYIFYQRTDYD
jgi:hypothetical protein